jgi:hypothetical protein
LMINAIFAHAALASDVNGGVFPEGAEILIGGPALGSSHLQDKSASANMPN